MIVSILTALLIALIFILIIHRPRFNTVLLTKPNRFRVYYKGKPVCDYTFKTQTYSHFYIFNDYTCTTTEICAIVDSVYEPKVLKQAITYLKSNVCSNAKVEV